MLAFLKSVFVAVLNFGPRLTLQSFEIILLNNEPCLVRSTLFGLNPDELHYYHIMICLNIGNESFNTVDDSTDRICVLIKRKLYEFKHDKRNVLKIITRTNESKSVETYIFCVIVNVYLTLKSVNLTKHGTKISVAMNLKNHENNIDVIKTLYEILTNLLVCVIIFK